MNQMLIRDIIKSHAILENGKYTLDIPALNAIACDMQQALQVANVTRSLPKRFPIATLENTSSHVFSIWFWRKKRKDGSMYHSRTINIAWMLKIWRQNKVAPQWGYRTNGAKRSAGDTCLDATFSLGYLILNYVDWDLQGNGG